MGTHAKSSRRGGSRVPIDGDSVRRLRLAAGLTLKQLGEGTSHGLSPMFVSDIEHKRRRRVSKEVLEHLARALSVAPASLQGVPDRMDLDDPSDRMGYLRALLEILNLPPSLLASMRYDVEGIAEIEERFRLLLSGLGVSLPDLARELARATMRKGLKGEYFRGIEDRARNLRHGRYLGVDGRPTLALLQKKLAEKAIRIKIMKVKADADIAQHQSHFDSVRKILWLAPRLERTKKALTLARELAYQLWGRTRDAEPIRKGPEHYPLLDSELTSLRSIEFHNRAANLGLCLLIPDDEMSVWLEKLAAAQTYRGAVEVVESMIRDEEIHAASKHCHVSAESKFFRFFHFVSSQWRILPNFLILRAELGQSDGEPSAKPGPPQREDLLFFLDRRSLFFSDHFDAINVYHRYCTRWSAIRATLDVFKRKSQGEQVPWAIYFQLSEDLLAKESEPLLSMTLVVGRDRAVKSMTIDLPLLRAQSEFKWLQDLSQIKSELIGRTCETCSEYAKGCQDRYKGPVIPQMHHMQELISSWESISSVVDLGHEKTG